MENYILYIIIYLHIMQLYTCILYYIIYSHIWLSSQWENYKLLLLARIAGCSGRSFQVISSHIVSIPLFYDLFHFCLTHLRRCNIIQVEKDFRRTLVQPLAQRRVNCKVKHVVQEFICSDLETLQGCRLHSPSGQPLLLLAEVKTIPSLVYYHCLSFFLNFIFNCHATP